MTIFIISILTVVTYLNNIYIFHPVNHLVTPMNDKLSKKGVVCVFCFSSDLFLFGWIFFCFRFVLLLLLVVLLLLLLFCQTLIE